MRNWLLPEHIEDVLPPQARRVEALRGTLLELFRVHGYELVIPPLLEYLESLLTGTGHDLDLRTFKLVDQLTGRMMGLRADITPQVARIDAHLLNREGIARLCYAGSVAHTLARGLNATREPLQIGAEIYGHAGMESDLEIRSLLLRSLRACAIGGARLDLGHVAVFRTLCQRGGISPDLEAQLHEAIEAKDAPRLEALSAGLDGVTSRALRALPGLYGDASVLERARTVLPQHAEILAALDDLTRLSQCDELPVSIDLADLRGYQYHSGVVFSAYAPGLANAVALGGRYDEVGKAFGRARPATGFSMDLRDLAQLAPPMPDPVGIRAPYAEDPQLDAQIDRLRATGEVVLVELPGHQASGGVDCDRELVPLDGQWQVRRI